MQQGNGTQILNIDSLKSSSTRTINLAGKEHVMKEMSVGDFLKITGLAEQADEKATLTESIKFIIDVVLTSFPTCTREELESCTIEQLNAIAEFAKSGSLPEQAVVAELVDESDEPKKRQVTRKQK